jgi:hypothetical protein
MDTTDRGALVLMLMGGFGLVSTAILNSVDTFSMLFALLMMLSGAGVFVMRGRDEAKNK